MGALMSDYNDGKIHGWNGGECPVHPESEVMVWLRSASFTIGTEAGLVNWVHGVSDTDMDIIAFQVTKPYIEPKVIWVNEWANGDGYSYPKEEDAEKNAGTHNTRIAVKYVEEK